MTQYAWRAGIGKRGESNRRVTEINGRPYHVTKGWRGREPRSDLMKVIEAMQTRVAAMDKWLASEERNRAIELPRTIDATEAENALDIAFPINFAPGMVKPTIDGDFVAYDDTDLSDPDFSVEPLPIPDDPIVAATREWTVDDYLKAKGVIRTLGANMQTLPFAEMSKFISLRHMVAVYEDEHGILPG